MATAYGTALAGYQVCTPLTQIAVSAALSLERFQKSKCIETDSAGISAYLIALWGRTSQAVSVLDPGSLCGMFTVQSMSCSYYAKIIPAENPENIRGYDICGKGLSGNHSVL
ncbi:MAG: hypothetical protein ACLTNW_17525 [Mediterraneibacter gnavus]